HSLIYTFYFKYTPTSEIYSLSLHDALPISRAVRKSPDLNVRCAYEVRTSTLQRAELSGFPSLRKFFQRSQPEYHHRGCLLLLSQDRKSTRLNSSHVAISYAVFCLKKKKIKK